MDSRIKSSVNPMDSRIKSSVNQKSFSTQPKMSKEMWEIVSSFKKTYLYDIRQEGCDENIVDNSIEKQVPPKISSNRPSWNNFVLNKIIPQQNNVVEISRQIKIKSERVKLKQRLADEFSLKQVTKRTEDLLLRKSRLDQTLLKKKIVRRK